MLVVSIAAVGDRFPPPPPWSSFENKQLSTGKYSLILIQATASSLVLPERLDTDLKRLSKLICV